MAHGTQDLLLYAGITYPATGDPAQWEYRAGTPDPVTGLPPLVDLTGWSAVMKARTTPSAATAILSLTSGAGITLGGVLGTVRVTISSAQSLGIGAGIYPYDLVLTSPGGASEVLVEGSLQIKQLVSR